MSIKDSSTSNISATCDTGKIATLENPKDEGSSLSIIVKHGGSEYQIINLMPDHSINYLKLQIEDLTNVRVERQKLFGIKTKNGQQLNDDIALEDTNFSNGMKIMMMGSQEKEIQGVEKASKSGLQPVEDDFDMQDVDEAELDSRIPNDPDYLAKINHRIKYYEFYMLNEPRPGKKLLVLDIDYTLFDHRSTAQTAAELMRPYLHEFLTSAYRDYDIIIWSATSMKYIIAKMNELKVSKNENYKIVCYLDSGAMISVHSQKYGLLNVKPLAVIWGKLSQYSSKNTIMFDDTRRNFLMNPQNGLKIKAFREAHKNRETDQELLHLMNYLSKIAELDDLTILEHKHWQRSIAAPKRHKTSR